jgi:hypothetical protein
MRAILPAVVVTATLGVLAWQVACGPDLTYVSKDQFAGEYAAALCSSLQGCCSENGVSYDYAQCQAGWKSAIENLLYGPNSSGNYSTTLGTSCVQQVRAAQGASCQPVPGSLSAARDTCQAAVAGNTPQGAPCTSSAQCAPVEGGIVACAIPAGSDDAGGGELPLSAPGVTLQDLTLQDVAVCVVSIPPAIDAGMVSPTPCTINAAAGTDTCTSTGGYCDPKALTCSPAAAKGGACDPSVVASCQAGNYCSGGMCVPAGPIGTPCTAPAMCDSTGFCDVTGSHTCTAILGSGMSCTSSAQCTIGVCDATTHNCLTNAIATTAACTGAVKTP